MRDEFLVLMVILAVGSLVVSLAKMHYASKEKRGEARGLNGETRRLSGEDEEMLQRLWDTAGRMEERMQNLETILMERSRERSYRETL